MPKKIICMAGLPGSGKSTKAREIMQAMPGTVRLSHDELRAMLHVGNWSGKKEGITRAVQRGIVKTLLEKNIGVIFIDDCNLNPGVIESWKALAQEHNATIDIVKMDTSIEACLRRNALRDKSVGRHVILGMAMQYRLMPQPEKGYVLCDIDGTLADIQHRRYFVQQDPKDWNGFFESMQHDTVREDILEQVHRLFYKGYEVVFVSSRPDTYRAFTEQWLIEQCHWIDPLVFMRRGDDRRPDTEVKKHILHIYFPDTSLIKYIFDDRPSVIKMWKSEGLHVIDVGNGENF